MAEWDVVIRVTVTDAWDEEKRATRSFTLKISKCLRGECFPCSDRDDEDKLPVFDASLSKGHPITKTLDEAHSNERDVIVSAKNVSEKHDLLGFCDANGQEWVFVKAAEIEPVNAAAALKSLRTQGATNR